MIYLDNSATTRPYDEVIGRMAGAMRDAYFNASAAYGPALAVERETAACRETIASRLGAEALFLAADIQAKAGDNAAAAALYRELFDKHPDDRRAAEARFPAAWALCRAGRPKDALAVAEAALRATPPPDAEHALELSFVRAQALFELGRLEEAADAFGAVAASPDAVRSTLRPRAAYLAGLSLYKLGDADGVAAALPPALADPELQMETSDLGGRFAVTLSVTKPAFYVWVNAWKIKGEFDDNLLTLMPGERRTIIFTPAERGVSFDAFRKSLSVANLYGAKKER